MSCLDFTQSRTLYANEECVKTYRVRIKETFTCYIDVATRDKDEAYELVGKQVDD